MCFRYMNVEYHAECPFLTKASGVRLWYILPGIYSSVDVGIPDVTWNPGLLFLLDYFSYGMSLHLNAEKSAKKQFICAYEKPRGYEHLLHLYLGEAISQWSRNTKVHADVGWYSVLYVKWCTILMGCRLIWWLQLCGQLVRHRLCTIRLKF